MDDIASTDGPQFLNRDRRSNHSQIGSPRKPKWYSGEDGAYIRRIYAWMYYQFTSRVQLRGSRAWMQRRHPRWDGGKYRDHEYPNIWPTIATHLATHDLPAFGWVEFVFESCSHTPPNPDLLIKHSGVAAFRAKLKENVTTERLLLRCHISKFNSEKTCVASEFYPDDELAQVVFTLCRMQSRLFGICAAAYYGVNDLQFYFADAAREYIRKPDVYEHAWSIFLPVGFRELVFRHYGL